MRKPAAGFTTVELLIAMQMALLLAGFVYAAYFFAARLAANWRQKIALENAAPLCMRTLAQEILLAQQIMAASDTVLVLKSPRGMIASFAVQNGVLHRNQQPLHSAALQIRRLVFRYAKIDSVVGRRMLKISAPAYFHPQTAAELSQIALIEIELMIGDDKKQMRLKSTLHPRNTRLRLFNSLPLESSNE